MKFYKIIFIGLLLGISACSDSLLEETPPNLITSERLFSNLSGFNDSITGLYALVKKEKESLSGTAMVADMVQNGTDNMVTNHSVSGFTTIAERWQAVNNPSETFYEDVFTWLYSIVNAANTIITEAETASDDIMTGDGKTATENRNLILAEARAIRAWAYRHLTFGWGDVPLSLVASSGVTIRTDWERTPVAEVRKQLIADLRFAEAIIPIEPEQAGKITKGAIQTYLAEMYLTIDKADSALYFADKAINTPNYKLITQRYGVNSDEPGVPFMDMFQDGNINRSEGNTETLWTFQYEKNVVGGGDMLLRRHHHSRYVNIKIGTVSPLQITEERGGQGYGRMSLTKWAIENYEEDDDRGSHFAIRKFFVLKDAAGNTPAPADRLPEGYAYGDTIFMSSQNDISATSRSRVDWPWSRKVDYGDPLNLTGSSSFKDVIYLRLAETYLLKAEAQFKLGDAPGAATTLNVLRARVNASLISAADVTIDFILDERSRELLAEEHRRYTLLRTDKWIERTRLYNHNGGQLIEDKDKLFPIPQVVIDANLTVEMKQNEGYQQ